MNIIELAKEAGFSITTDWMGRPSFVSIGTHGDIGLKGTQELERFAAIVRAEELKAVYEEFYTSITSDLEHGVKSSNERAADKFKKEYPQLYKFWEWMNIRISAYEGENE